MNEKNYYLIKKINMKNAMIKIAVISSGFFIFFPLWIAAIGYYELKERDSLIRKIKKYFNK